MSFSFRIGRSTVHDILKETCKVIWDVLQQQYVKAPTTPDDWVSISSQFEKIWNFPHCIGTFMHMHVIKYIIMSM